MSEPPGDALIVKAGANLNAARLLTEANYLDAAASRAYQAETFLTAARAYIGRTQ